MSGVRNLGRSYRAAELQQRPGLRWLSQKRRAAGEAGLLGDRHEALESAGAAGRLVLAAFTAKTNKILTKHS